MEWVMKEKLVGLETTRYSEFFRRVFEQYTDEDIVVKINGQKYSASDIPLLLEHWCTNAKVKSTRDFCLWRGKNELFSFHDHPAELFASVSELPFLGHLASEKVIRIKVE